MVKTPKNDESEILAEAFSGIMSGKKDEKPKTRKKFKRSFKIILGVILAILILIPVSVFALQLSQPSATEKELAKYQPGINFTLYQPTKLPPGYKLDASKTTNTGGALFLVFSSSENGKPNITLTQQATPSGIGIEALLGLKPPTPSDISIGKLYMVNTEQDNMAIVVTDKSWIITSANKALSASDLSSLASSLQPL